MYGIDYKDLANWEEDTIELIVGRQHRVTLHTMHGTVIIDVRAADVNAFVKGPNGRVDYVLLRAADQTSAARADDL